MPLFYLKLKDYAVVESKRFPVGYLAVVELTAVVEHKKVLSSNFAVVELTALATPTVPTPAAQAAIFFAISEGSVGGIPILPAVFGDFIELDAFANLSANLDNGFFFIFFAILTKLFFTDEIILIDIDTPLYLK